MLCVHCGVVHIWIGLFFVFTSIRSFTLSITHAHSLLSAHSFSVCIFLHSWRFIECVHPTEWYAILNDFILLHTHAYILDVLSIIRTISETIYDTTQNILSNWSWTALCCYTVHTHTFLFTHSFDMKTMCATERET